MLRVGLTGGIGAGKSAVSARLAELGAVVVDADRIAREVVERGTAGLRAVVTEFGPGILTDDGTLDRAALGAIVFGDTERLQALNAIVHPLVATRSAQLLDAAPAGSVVVYDVPLLVENELQGGFDLVVVVDAPGDVVRQRLFTSRGMSLADVDARVAAQATREARRAVADVVIDNSGDLADLRAHVDRLWNQLTPRAD